MRPRPESNWRIADLQSAALPLCYSARAKNTLFQILTLVKNNHIYYAQVFNSCMSTSNSLAREGLFNKPLVTI